LFPGCARFLFITATLVIDEGQNREEYLVWGIQL